MIWKTAQRRITRERFALLAIVCLTLLSVQACSKAIGPVYLKYNIHAQEHRGIFHASYTNWTSPPAGHFVIPVNTQVYIDPDYDDRRMLITEVATERKTIFEYNAHHMGMGEVNYVKLITSPQALSLEGLSALDRKGIQEGKAWVGMSKRGVMIALGYPATFLTKSLEDNVWTYCTGRFGKLYVEFDDKGFVRGFRNKQHKDSVKKAN